MIPALAGEKKEDHQKFEASLGYSRPASENLFQTKEIKRLSEAEIRKIVV